MEEETCPPILQTEREREREGERGEGGVEGEVIKRGSITGKKRRVV